MEIGIKVTVIWENRKNLNLFTENEDLVEFTLGELYQDQDDTKKFLNEIKQKENDVCVCIFGQRTRRLN